jgi:hypothetical protein
MGHEERAVRSATRVKGKAADLVYGTQQAYNSPFLGR